MQRLQPRLAWWEQSLPEPHQVGHGQLGQKDKAQLQGITVPGIVCGFCNLSFLIVDTIQQLKKKIRGKQFDLKS